MIARSAMLALCLAVGLAPRAGAQQRPHIIRGRVTTDSGVVIPAADVIVTVAPTAESIVGKSDSSGVYRITIPNPTGEYILYIGALGRKAFRQRVTIAAKDSVAVVDAKLAATVTAVAAVRVQAQKPRPPRSLANDGLPGTDATDRSIDGVTTALPPDLQGNLEAMASFIPGLAIGPLGGVSAFGLGPDANSTTLNGLAFGGTDLPRDATTQTRFRTSVWDPTVGGFSGVQTSTTMGSGGNVARRRGHITVDAPSLQFSDPVAGRLGQEYTRIALDEGGTGPYRLDKYFYNFGVHADRQTWPVASLANVDPDALARAGITSDSASRLLQLLGGLRVPVSVGGIPRDRTTTTVSYIERIDRAPDPTPRNAPPAPILAATLIGKYSQSEAASLSPTVAPATSGKTSSGLAGIQGLYSRFFGKDGDYVSETTSGLSLSRSRGTPYLELPGGSVLVTSPDGIGSLGFGGNSMLGSDSRNWTWETINQTDFLAAGHASLPMKIYLQSRFDGYSQSLAANRLGRFSFASLNDVAINQPSSFSRTLNAPDRSGGEWIGAGALGGNWINDSFSLTGGARIDANAFTAAPHYNAALDRTLGMRTDHAPDGFGISPRLGFSWTYLKPKQGDIGSGLSIMTNGIAVAIRGNQTIRGGIGKFRSVPQPTLLADATSSTGLPGGMQQLLCIGSAVPVPDWSSYSADPATVPSTCAGGASTFADTARTVTLFDRAYAPPESWRGNLGWTNSHFLWNYVSIDATYSYNIHQPGTIDLNFAGAPRFALSGEGNRPVFVDPTSIVPNTGTVSSVQSRVSQTYGRVSDRVSDLRSDAKQIALSALPDIPFEWGMLFVGYTYADTRAQARGFDGSTSGDPRATEWAAGSFAPRHTVTVQYGRRFFGGNVGVSAAMRASSGFTFTPTVAGDINGDGTSNDRAFVYNPAVAPDTALSNGLSSLLRSGSGSARDCLSRQFGTIAARNSCVGPWYATMNGNVTILKIPHYDRMRAALNFANVSGALDEILHGENNLRGWGLVPLPDPTLYQVRGFDPVAKRFIYQVNPRFGASGPSTTTRRSPFRISLDVQLDLGRSIPEQQVEQNIRIRPSMLGTRAPADSIKARYIRSGFSDLFALMLRFGDSLALSRDQLERVQAEQVTLKARADTIYAGLAAYLVALPSDFDVKDAVKHVTAAGDSAWAIVLAEKPFLINTLTPGQIRLLPGPIRDMVMTPDFKGKFFFGGF